MAPSLIDAHVDEGFSSSRRADAMRINRHALERRFGDTETSSKIGPKSLSPPPPCPRPVPVGPPAGRCSALAAPGVRVRWRPPPGGRDRRARPSTTSSSANPIGVVPAQVDR